MTRQGWTTTAGWERGSHSTGQVAARWLRDKTLMCPASPAEYPGRSSRAMPQLQQRTNRSIFFYVIRKSMGGRAKTHEDKHSIGISFPTFCHLSVLFLGNIEIHRKKSSRTIGRVGLSLLGLILRGWRVAVAIYSWYERDCGLANIRCVPGPGSTWAPCSRSGSLGSEDIEGDDGREKGAGE
jgi:hypothetical protein